MNLRVVIGTLVVFAIGCGKEPPPPAAPPPVVELSTDQLIVKALEGLKVSGVPEAPLSPTATREQRNEYLLATETSRKALEELVVAPVPNLIASKTLLSTDRTDEILAFSRALGVQIADAIDRGDVDGAKKAFFIGFRYADLVGRISVADWVASGAIADGLCQGIKSVSKQVDAKLADAMRQAVEDMNAKAPDPGATVLETLNRIKAWAAHISASKEDVTPEQVLMEISSNTSGRQLPSPAIEALKKRATGGKLSAAFVAKEAHLAQVRSEEFLNGARSGSIMQFKPADPKVNPLAALYMSVLRPNIEAAPKLAEIREENLRLVALTVRIIAAGMPADLTAFGQDAISPVSGMKFEYKKSGESFELVRPRAKA